MELVVFVRRLRAQSRLSSREHQALDDIAGLICSIQADMALYEQHALTASQVYLGIKTYFNELSPKLEARKTMLCQQKAEVDEISNIIVQLQRQYCGEREIQRLVRCHQQGRRLAEKAYYDTGIYASMSFDYNTLVLKRFEDKHQQYALSQLQDDFRDAGALISNLEAEARDMEWTTSVIATAAEKIANETRQNPQNRTWRALDARLDVLDDFFNEDDDDQPGKDRKPPSIPNHALQRAPLSAMATRSNTPDLADRVRPEEEEDSDHKRKHANSSKMQVPMTMKYKFEKLAGTQNDMGGLKAATGASFSAVEDQIAHRGHARASTMYSSNYATIAPGPPQLGSVIRRNGRSVPRIFTGSFDELEEGLERLRVSAANTPQGSSIHLTALTARSQDLPSINVRDFATPENGTPDSSIPSTPTIYLRRRGASKMREAENHDQSANDGRQSSVRAPTPIDGGSGNRLRPVPEQPFSAPAHVSSITEPPTRANSHNRRARQRENTL